MHLVLRNGQKWQEPCEAWERHLYFVEALPDADLASLLQVFCGNAAKSIAVWEPPASEMQDKVLLNGHTGWVRALAAEGRWLFR